LTYENMCIQCHMLNIISSPDLQNADWGNLLIRMQEKAPDLLSQDEALALLPFIEGIRKDPGLLAREIPHHSARVFFGRLEP